MQTIENLHQVGSVKPSQSYSQCLFNQPAEQFVLGHSNISIYVWRNKVQQKTLNMRDKLIKTKENWLVK